MPNNFLLEKSEQKLNEVSASDRSISHSEVTSPENSEKKAFYEYDPADDVDDGLGIKFEQAFKVVLTHLAFSFIAVTLFSSIGFCMNASLQDKFIHSEETQIIYKKYDRQEVSK